MNPPMIPPAATVRYDFTGRTVLVTGAASGIGRATSIRFAQAGANVVLADVDTDAGHALADDLDGAAVFVHTDVRDESSVAALVAAAVERFGRLDIAFNNAGIEGRPGRTVAELDEADWLRVLDINLSGVWRCMKHELAHMTVRGGGGTIVNTSSTAGLASGVNAGVAYAASKHGVIGLTRTAAKEYRRHGIRINAVCPGGVDTPLLERTVGTDAIDAARQRPATLATPDQIADAVLWLSSDAASYVNGHALLIDNGFLA